MRSLGGGREGRRGGQRVVSGRVQRVRSVVVREGMEVFINAFQGSPGRAAGKRGLRAGGTDQAKSDRDPRQRLQSGSSFLK